MGFVGDCQVHLYERPLLKAGLRLHEAPALVGLAEANPLCRSDSEVFARFSGLSKSRRREEEVRRRLPVCSGAKIEIGCPSTIVFLAPYILEDDGGIFAYPSNS